MAMGDCLACASCGRSLDTTTRRSIAASAAGVTSCIQGSSAPSKTHVPRGPSVLLVPGGLLLNTYLRAMDGYICHALITHLT